jgi:tryptophanyl-tRNA synthetase
MSRPVSVTGVQPTGNPHIGNYAGAIRPSIELAKTHEVFYFIADGHALNDVWDAAKLREHVLDVAATWVAFGLDPEQQIMFRQSDVIEHFELAWMLGCVTPKGMMNRAHAYKAVVQENRENGVSEEDVDRGVVMGLFSYPVLMAADILIYNADVVPVGRDQQQHLEMTRDIAMKFNSTFGEVLKVPKAYINEKTATILGTDGRKMSKSYGNTLPLFASPDELAQKIKRAQTDSSRPEDPKDPETSFLFQVYREVAPSADVEQMATRLSAGGMGWAEVKTAVTDALLAFLSEPRERYTELTAHPEEIKRMLDRGAKSARAVAVDTLSRCRVAVGYEPVPTSQD